MAEEKKKGFDLSDKLKGVSKLNIGLQEQPQLEYIDIDLIDPDPRNRKVEGIPELAQNIALVGLQQPLAVRANPDAEGRYIAISGHRRRLAIKQLVEEGEEKFRAVPCLVAPPGMSDAMVRLMILSGNMVTQSLTAAQMADATTEMEDAIYQLKKEGHEFPGKVRDWVGKACGIAGSRVTRLKGIQKNLAEPWVAHWENGELSEAGAYALSRMDPRLQAETYRVLTHAGTAPVKNITAERLEYVAADAELISDIESAVCSEQGGVPCERIGHRREAAIKYGAASWCACCCLDCGKRYTCSDACEYCKSKAKEEMAAEELEEATEEARDHQAEEAALRFAVAGWRRLGEALDRAGKSVLWLTELLDWDPGEDGVEMFESLLHRGEVTKDNLWIAEDHPLQAIYTPDLIKLANELGVSMDYLFGRTDEPDGGKGAPSESGKWVYLDWIPPHKKPDAEVLVALRFELEKGENYVSLGMWFNEKWCTRAGTPLEAEVTGWFPLPWTAENEEDPEE